ncbi:2-oxo-tetronate isomerase [Oryzomicrobium sp.]|uniref:2-oxo-tetronate isomerase n=1 Tax=Oryzomicrobium sp. TaxID=1911578 RepID=UPI002FE3552B
MLKFAANLTFLFADRPFLDRFAAAAQAGFAGVEYLFPYDVAAEEIRARLTAHDLTQALFNLPAGDWAGGERGLAALPGREADFRAGLDLARRYAAVLGCTRLHAMAGIPPAGADPAAVRATYLANIRHAARVLAADGITLMIEPINSRIDMPGYWLDSPRAAFALLDSIGEANVRVQYDLYHAQIMEGNLARTLEYGLARTLEYGLAGAAPRIGHLQVADNPGRGEPGSGEIAYPFLFATLERLGYDGWIGCEYKPAASTEAGLGWFAPYRRRDRPLPTA